MCVARTEDELIDLASTADVEFLAESVADPEGCARIVHETSRRLGPAEILINNPGIGSAGERPIWKQTPEKWRETLEVNLEAPFHLTRLVAGDMIRRRYGRIVMVSSTAGQLGGPAMTAYCSTKAGLLGLTRAVAHDVGPFGVTCNAVPPGWVRTEMAERKAERGRAASREHRANLGRTRRELPRRTRHRARGGCGGDPLPLRPAQQRRQWRNDHGRLWQQLVNDAAGLPHQPAGATVSQE